MNEIELQANQLLSSYLVHNLAINPKLPFEDNSFDACIITVSVPYLVHPITVFKEIDECFVPIALASFPFLTAGFRLKLSIYGVN